MECSAPTIPRTSLLWDWAEPQNNSENNQTITKLKQTDKFTHLEGVISSDGTAEQDIQRRIGLAYDGMNRLDNIWKSKDLSTKTKVLVYNSMVIGILIYVQLGNLDADRETKEQATSIRDELSPENPWCVKTQEPLTSEIQTSIISSTSSMTLWTGSEAAVLDTSNM